MDVDEVGARLWDVDGHEMSVVGDIVFSTKAGAICISPRAISSMSRSGRAQVTLVARAMSRPCISSSPSQFVCHVVPSTWTPQ